VLIYPPLFRDERGTPRERFQPPREAQAPPSRPEHMPTAVWTGTLSFGLAVPFG